MPGFDYGNARLRAMKSSLLSRQEMEALADADSLQSLIAALTRTAYGKAIEVAITRAGGPECIADALHRNLVDTVCKIRTFYDEQEGEQVGFVLRRYDVHNLKTILRGRATYAPTDEIAASLLPLGELTGGILDQLIRAPNPRAVIDLLATMRLPYAQPLLVLRAEHPGAETPEMELALDRWYFQEAREQLGKTANGSNVLAQALDLEADIVNLLTVLRFVHAPAERQVLEQMLHTNTLQDLFVLPGRVPLELLVRASEYEGLPSAVDALADTPYAAPLKSGLDQYRQSARLSDFEKQLQLYRLRRMAGFMAQDPLGIGVLLGYLALKTTEIGNIRWVAQGINLGLKADAVKAELEFAA